MSSGNSAPPFRKKLRTVMNILCAMRLPCFDSKVPRSGRLASVPGSAAAGIGQTVDETVELEDGS